MNASTEDITDEELSQAVALFYDGQSAPTITAMGEGATADEIIRIAKEHDVPLCDNAPLVGLLSELELGDNIPEELYIAIAHIIAFAYRIKLMSEDELSGE